MPLTTQQNDNKLVTSNFARNSPQPKTQKVRNFDTHIKDTISYKAISHSKLQSNNFSGEGMYGSANSIL